MIRYHSRNIFNVALLSSIYIYCVCVCVYVCVCKEEMCEANIWCALKVLL